MGDLRLYDRSRAIKVYEDSRQLTQDGGLVSKYRYYEEFSSVDSPLAKFDGSCASRDQSKRLERAMNMRSMGSRRREDPIDSLAFMVFMNSICLFFVMVAMVVRSLIG